MSTGEKIEAMTVVKVENIYEKIINFFASLSMMSVAIMSIGISFDVLKRWITGRPIGGVMLLSECLMVVLVFLGIAYTQKHRRHIRIAFLISRMKPKVIVLFDLIATIFAVICLGMLAWETAVEAVYSIEILEYKTGDVRMPIYWARAIIPVGICAMIGQLFIVIWKDIERLKGNLPAEIADVRSVEMDRENAIIG